MYTDFGTIFTTEKYAQALFGRLQYFDDLQQNNRPNITKIEHQIDQGYTLML